MGCASWRAIDKLSSEKRVAAAKASRKRFFNLVDLVNQLEQEKAAGRSGRLSEKLLRYDLIVIDELGYLPFSQSTPFFDDVRQFKPRSKPTMSPRTTRSPCKAQ